MSKSAGKPERGIEPLYLPYGGSGLPLIYSGIADNYNIT